MRGFGARKHYVLEDVPGAPLNANGHLVLLLACAQERSQARPREIDIKFTRLLCFLLEDVQHVHPLDKLGTVHQSIRTIDPDANFHDPGTGSRHRLPIASEIPRLYAPEIDVQRARSAAAAYRRLRPASAASTWPPSSSPLTAATQG